jgi:hypothetical protein
LYLAAIRVSIASRRFINWSNIGVRVPVPLALKRASKLPELPEFEKIDLRLKRMFSRSLLHAQDVADWAGVPTFLEALAPFVRQSRLSGKGELGGMGAVADQKDSSVDWARKLKISVHSGVKYWTPDLNSSDPEGQIRQIARCRWNWQNMNESTGRAILEFSTGFEVGVGIDKFFSEESSFRIFVAGRKRPASSRGLERMFLSNYQSK